MFLHQSIAVFRDIQVSNFVALIGRPMLALRVFGERGNLFVLLFLFRRFAFCIASVNFKHLLLTHERLGLEN